MDAVFEEVFCEEYHQAAELIGRRWNGAVLRALLCGLSRFSDLKAGVPGLSDRLLSVRLRELEAEGVLESRAPEGRARAEYFLTEKGRDLAEVVFALARWAERWKAPDLGGPNLDTPDSARVGG